ncbi:MAG TPA: hypothetical protein VMB51_00780 [Solirubrobacteraceae bacterium]|nr:hypothetical protein [Solirubrobacteraceae bacterium]
MNHGAARVFGAIDAPAQDGQFYLAPPGSTLFASSGRTLHIGEDAAHRGARCKYARAVPVGEP